MNLIQQAALFSRAAHQAVGQKRKYTNEPYWHHPQTVAQLVYAANGTPEMIAAAYLHDVLEDTQVTAADLKACFSEPVAILVHELTDQFTDPGLGNRAHRKALERDRLAMISAEAQTIKYADLIDNTGSIVERDPGFAGVYLDEKRRLLDVMVHGDQKLWRQAWGLMVEGEVAVAEHHKRNRANTYKVYINGRHVRTVYSEAEAWDIIRGYPLGTLHEVRDADDNVRREFITY